MTPQTSVPGGERKVSRAQLILILALVLLGFFAWLWIDRTVSVLAGPEPVEEQVQRAHDVPGRQAALTQLENERKAVGEQLVQARVELLKQTASVDGYRATYPQLADFTPGVPVSSTVPTATVAGFLDARVKGEAAQRLAAGLAARLSALDAETAEAGKILTQSQSAARDDLRRQQAAYRLRRAVPALLAGLVLILVLMFLIWVIQRIVARGRAPIGGKLVPLAVGAALLVLFAYQVLNLAGAVFAAILVLLAVWWLLPWDEVST